MQIVKDKIVEMLREDGDDAAAARADRELPDEIDTDRDAAALDKLGLDPVELVQRISGEGIPELS